MIGIGLGVLKLSSDAFWRLTPREFALATGLLRACNAPLDRGAMAQLMQRFPDGATGPSTQRVPTPDRLRDPTLPCGEG